LTENINLDIAIEEFANKKAREVRTVARKFSIGGLCVCGGGLNAKN